MVLWNEMEYARQWSRDKGVWHHAIIDHMDRLGLIWPGRPVIVELMPSGLQARPYDPTEVWERTVIADVAGARRRLRELLGMEDRRRYDWFSNNCEHIARYVAFGEFKSEQIQLFAVVSLVVGLLILARE